MIAAGNEEIEFVTYVERGDSRILLCFTDSMLLRTTIQALVPDNSRELTIECTPRWRLEELSMSAAESAYNPDSFAPWPGALTYELRYVGESESMNFPPHPPTNESEREALATLLPSLSRDLLAH